MLICRLSGLNKVTAGHVLVSRLRTGKIFRPRNAKTTVKKWFAEWALGKRKIYIIADETQRAVFVSGVIAMPASVKE
jgi:hypothetical protein